MTLRFGFSALVLLFATLSVAAQTTAPGTAPATKPAANYYGLPLDARRVAIILDHSGSMLDDFDFAKVETIRAVNSLAPAQSIAIVLVSDKVDFVGGDKLQNATDAAKKQIGEELKKVRAEGANDKLLGPFKQAFEKALALKPETIIFLSDSPFDPQLIPALLIANADHKVRIDTIAFVNESPDYKAQLKTIAGDHGGQFRFISEKELQRE